MNQPASTRLPDELEAEYVNLSHMETFAHYLQIADNDFDTTTTPPAHSDVPTIASRRFRKVSALSDFAPVNLKVSRRHRKTDRNHDRRQEWLYVLVRWPLLTFIFLFIMAEFGCYIVIRQLVNAKEWLSAWRGRKGLLRLKLRAATSYQEWKEAAQTLDDHLQYDEWKSINDDPFYDWKLVSKVRKSLKTLREKRDVRGLLGVLETCIRANFAGVESARLYSETFYGTKTLIESYVDEQEKALQFIRESPDISNEEKKRFFRSANVNLGASALCLSGGASFGYYHFGVVKAFLEADLLPRVISGTSAGGLVAALVCCYTDAELRRILVPELANRLTASEEPIKVWLKRVWQTGARFDSVTWAKKSTFFTRGSLTFREAYVRTGRILNISVIPADRHSPTKLLNYMTAPDCVIWSALLASAAVPGILNPVILMQKLKDDTVVPWNWGSRFKDGSLRVDIPVQALNLYFNVTHPVVSQVNPHVHLFFFAPQGSAGKPVAHRKGKGWRGNFLLSAAEQWLKLELTKNFKLIRDLDLLPQLLGQDWSSVFLQRFDGTVTIWPRTRLKDWLRILSDPDPPELERMMRVGQLVTWPKLHMIENRYRLEKQIFLGRQAVRRALQPKDKERASARQTQSNLVPASVTGTRIFDQANDERTPSNTDRDAPMALDTDTEIAFANNSPVFFKREHSGLHRSGSSTPYDLSKENVRQIRPVQRRRWTSSLFNKSFDGELSSPALATPDPPELETIAPQTAPSSPSFFNRLRSRSTMNSPFATLRASHRFSGIQAASENGFAWSSDSSDDDEDIPLDWRKSQQFPPLLNFPVEEGSRSEEREGREDNSS